MVSSFAFLRSNLLTFIDLSEFTETHCSAGYLLFTGSGSLCLASLHATFIRRIQLAFKNSTYEYTPYVYKILYALILINCVLNLIQIALRTFVYKHYMVIYTDLNGIGLCTNDSDADVISSLVQSGGAIAFGATNLLLNMILLYMFNRGLWLLNRDIMKGYIKTQQEYGLGNHPIPVENTSTVENLRATVDEYQTKGNKADAVIRIIELYNLIKKQTILVCIAVISTTMFMILTALDGDFFYEIGWDIVVNTVCVWMMLSTSKKYWNCCRDHGLCKCCYLQTGDVN